MISATDPLTAPLKKLFAEPINLHFKNELHLYDEGVLDYLATLLVECCVSDRLLAIRNAEGKPLEDIGEMLMESDPVYGPAPSFDRERQVRKHIGDCALFLAGMFPESINHYRLRKQRLENLIQIVKAGKESYYVVSKFEHFEYAKVAPLFATLSQRFEDCVYGLNLVKNEFEVMQYTITGRPNELIL
jgi:hypothetical protein